MVLDIHQTCRACTRNLDGAYVYKFSEEDVKSLFMECTSISISDVDDLPQQLCPGCFLKCLAWSNFKSLCHETNSRLEKQLKVGDTECEDLNIGIQDYVSDTPVDAISPEPLNNVEADSNEQDTTISESPRSNKPAQKLKNRRLTSRLDYCMPAKISRPRRSIGQRAPRRAPGEANPYDCLHCNLRYPSIKPRATHMMRAHPMCTPICGIVDINAELKCYMCNNKHEDFESLKNHLFENHVSTQTQNYKCDICKDGFRNSKDLLDHMLTSHQAIDFRCLECQHNCQQLSLITLHLQEIHEVPIEMCFTCGKWVKNDGKHFNSHPKEP